MSIDLPVDPALDTVPGSDVDPTVQMPPLNLSMWLAEAVNWGADPAGLGAELVRDVVGEALKVQPRSLQREIGPSEIGIPCPRRLGYKFAHVPPTGIAPIKWAAAVGTAVHREFTDWCLSFNERHGVTRFLPDLRVYVGDLYAEFGGGRPIFGTLDALDVATGTVIDLKGVHVDTPIPTPMGWTTMRDVQVGDEVFGADGQPCTVTEKSPVHWDRPCYRVTFDDGASIITDNVHEWQFEVDRRWQCGGRTVVVSTEDAIAMVVNPLTEQRQLRVRNAEALNLPEAELPVHPYVLGAWLGDGCRQDGTISKPDDELFDNIGQCGYRVSAPHGERGITRTVLGLLPDLRIAGLVWVEDAPELVKGQRYVGFKRIPLPYLRASAEQRLMLLRGLMDTDGTWNRKRNQAVFNSTDKQLAMMTAELIRSLGWKCRVFEHAASGFGKTVTAYAVPFVPYDVNPFWMSRKADLVRMAGSNRARKRVVRSIESIPIVPTQCIRVDAADSLFLVGEEMIPTHNCPGSTQMKRYAGQSPENPVYDMQVDLYGNGCRNAGFPVKSVGILRLPRAGTDLSQAGWKARAHDPANGEEGLKRVGRLAKMVEAGGADVLPLLPAVEHYCTSCDWFDPRTTDLRVGCPGAASLRETPARPSGPPSHMTDLIA